MSAPEPLHVPEQAPPRRPRRWPWILALCAVPLVIAGLIAHGELRAKDYHVPLAITASSTGKVLGVTTAAASGLRRLYVADAGTRQLTEVFCGNDVVEARVSPDGRRVLFIGSVRGSTMTYLYDVGAGSDPIPVEPAALLEERLPISLPVSVDWLSDGRAVFALRIGAGCAIVAYDADARTAELLGRLDDCDEVSLFCPQRSATPEVMAFVARGGEMRVMRLDARGKFVDLTPTPVDGWGLVSPDGARLLVNDLSSTSGYRIVATTLNTSGEPPVEVRDVPDADCADWSPSGELVAIGTIIIESRTGSPKAGVDLAAEFPPTEVQDVWFVDENRLLVLYGDSVYLADLTTNETTVVFRPPLRLPTVSEGGATFRRLLWDIGW